MDDLTTVAITIGGDTVSEDAVKVLVVAEENAAVRTFEITLRNSPNNKWGGHFTSKEAVSVTVDGEVLIAGYVDDVEPTVDRDFVSEDLIKVTGVDYGFDLQRLYITKKYPTSTLVKTDDIVEDALTESGGEVTFTSTSFMGDVAKYEFKRTYLSDGLKELCEEKDYAYYVDNSKALHLFTIDSGSEYLDGTGGRPDVDLLRLDEDSTTNILDVKEGENYGSKLFNYIELVAGPLMDHWTEGNSADWTANAYCSLSDSVGSALVDFLFGKAAIKLTSTSTAGAMVAYLDFSGGRYEYSSIDMSAEGGVDVGSYYFNFVAGSEVDYSCRIRLKDTSNNEIEFVRELHTINGDLTNATEDPDINRWYKVDFPYGKYLTIANTASIEGWYYLSKVTTFDWEHVVRIGIVANSPYGIPVDEVVLVDGLHIPTVEVKSIDQDATSIAAYGKRMYSKMRPDVTSQKQLDNLSASMLAKRKDPLQTLDVLAIGNPQVKFAGQSLDVQSPPNGIASLTRYRILKVTHRVVSRRNREELGFDYVMELKLTAYSNKTDAAYIHSSTNGAQQAILTSIEVARNLDKLQQDLHRWGPPTNYAMTPKVTSGMLDTDLQVEGDLTIVGEVHAFEIFADDDINITGDVWANNMDAAGDVTIDGDAHVGTMHADGDVEISGDAYINTIVGSCVAAENMRIDSVGTSNIIAQAVSIEKVDPAIASGAVAVLYTKLTEYSRTADADTTGAAVYTRNDIYADANMRYIIKHLLFYIKGDGVGGRPFGEIYPYASDSGVLGHFSHVPGSASYWTVQNVGNSGKQRFNTTWFNSPTYTYRDGGGVSSTQTGASDSDHPEVYHTYASVDATTYLQMHIANGSAPNALGSVTIQITVNGSNYTKAITGTALTTNHLLPSDFGIDPDTIDGFGTLTEIRIIYPNTATQITAPSVWFTKVVTYTYETASSTYSEYDSGELTIALDKGEPCNIAYYLGQGAYGNFTVYLEYPSSDVRSIGHLEAVT